MQNVILDQSIVDSRTKNENLSALQKWFGEEGKIVSQNYKINNDEYEYKDIAHQQYPKEHYKYNICIIIKEDQLSIFSENQEVWSIKLNAENSIFNIYKNDSARYQIYDICKHIVHFSIICQQNNISSEDQKAFNEFIKNLFENIFQNTSISADEFISLAFSASQNDHDFFIRFNLANVKDNNKSFITLESSNQIVHGVNFKDFLSKIPQFNTCNQNLDSISTFKIFTLLARSLFDYQDLDTNTILKDLQDKKNNLNRKKNCERIIDSDITSFNSIVCYKNIKLLALKRLNDIAEYQFTYKFNNEEYRFTINDKYLIDEGKKESEITIIEEKDFNSQLFNNEFQKTVEKKIDFNNSMAEYGFGVFDYSTLNNFLGMYLFTKCNTLIFEYLLNKKSKDNNLTINEDVKNKIIKLFMRLQENINWNTDTEDKTSIITIQFTSPLIKSNIYNLEIDLKNFTVDNPKIALYNNKAEKLKDLDFEGLSQIAMKEKSIFSDDLIDYFDIEEEKECKKFLQKETLYKKKKENIGMILMISASLCYALAFCTYALTELLSGYAFAGFILISFGSAATGCYLFFSAENKIQPNTEQLS